MLSIPGSIRPLRVRIALVVLLTSLPACEPSSPEAPGDAGWTIDEAPLLVIRDDDPESPIPIGEVSGATMLPNDEIVVIDRFGPPVYFFDQEGEVVRTVGRRGEGPGELIAPRWIDTCGTDSLFIFDYNRRIVVVLDLEGNFVREFRPESHPDRIRCLSDSTFLIMDLPKEFPPLSAEGIRGDARVWVANHDGKEIQEIGTFPGFEYRVMGRHAYIASTGGHVVVGTADSAYVDVFSRADGFVAALPIGSAPRPPTKEEFEREFEFWLTPARGIPERRDYIRSLHAHVPPPEFVYPYRELLGDPEGILWAVASPMGEENTRIQAVDPAGTLRADFRVPSGFTPLEVGPDYLMGEQVAEDFSREFVLYRLNRTER